MITTNGATKPSMNEASDKDPINNNSYGTLVDQGYKPVHLPVLDVHDFNERIIRGLVPISEMFAYASALRGATQGRGSFSMEFSEYRDVPASIAEKALKGDGE